MFKIKKGGKKIFALSKVISDACGILESNMSSAVVDLRSPSCVCTKFAIVWGNMRVMLSEMLILRL